MKVLNLACQLGHSFEGWFGGEADFQEQLQRGLLTCPMCGDDHVAKLPSAPRLNLKGGVDPAGLPSMGSKAASVAPGQVEASPSATRVAPQAGEGHPSQLPLSHGFSQEMQAVFLKALREVMVHTEDVGDRFPEQARRMHHGEVEHKAIRGEATLKDAQALLDEGIDVVHIPFLPGIKNTLQ